MNVVYNASAGTGKTFQVTRLYESLVLAEGVDPREILLVTFTENAAAELRMRVSHRLLKARRTAEEAGDDALAERATGAIARLPSAPISTIHAYCTRLLREHALEAGLSPGFSLIEGDERRDLLDQIVRNNLLARLETDPAFRAFCAGAHLIGTGQGFGASITEAVPMLIAQAGSLGIPLENAATLLPAPTSGPTRIDFEHICRRIRELPKITPAVGEALALIEEGLAATADAEQLVAWLTDKGIKKFGRGAKEISDDFWALKEATEEAARYRERFPAAQAFARFLQDVAVEFHQRKHEMDAVDFDDLLRMAAALLASGRAKPTFRHVIVDEVQDTSRIQCNLIEALWGAETNLVICGDRKQSVYTWRGADPQVMPDLERRILAAGGERQDLKTSFRSKAPILDIVNALFQTVYGPKGYPASDHLEPNPGFETPGEKPCVEFLAYDGDPDADRQDKTAAEMAAVTDRIRLLVAGSADWRPAYRHADGFQPAGENNAYRYADILILLRRTTHQPALEQALRHAGIPYTLGGKGRGLFTRQETRDVSLFLNVLTNPSDALSLVGFLRSPWVGLSDETIAEFAWSGAGFSMENLIANAAEKIETIARYRALLGTKLASELVRLLIDETGYDALLAGLPRGTQRLANLRKALDWLREAERGAQTTPAAVARKLARQIADPPDVPEAALLDPAQNAVTVMTVHGSKGLTKRVVFIPDTSARPNHDRGFAQAYLDERGEPGLGLKITAPDKSSAESPGFKAARERAKQVREQEANNLFYVAMTRARDLVVASATVGKQSAGWCKQMEPLIGTAIPSIPYAVLHAAAETSVPPERTIPTLEHLAAALATLPPPPAPPSLRRIPATRLAGEQDEPEPLYSSPDDGDMETMEKAAALGSLGHAVLEQLALNGWNGSVAEWLERLRPGFAIAKPDAAQLAGRIEHTRELMRGLTDGAAELRPEFPFVLREGDLLVDGTIDLLCLGAAGVCVFDYKFTEAGDAAVAEQYRGQMAIYCKAAARAFPNAGNASARLVVVSRASARLVSFAF